MMDEPSDVLSVGGDQDKQSAYEASWIQHTVKSAQDEQSALVASCVAGKRESG